MTYLISHSRLRDLVDYDPQTGAFTWRPRDASPGFNGKRLGSRVGTLNHGGYLIIKLDRRRYFAHRLAWMFVHGHFPSGLIDHKDRDRTNNRIDNLRVASTVENVANSKITCRNTTGVKGTSYHAKSGKWRATIGANGKSYHLGFFPDIDAAGAAYIAAAERLFGEFATDGVGA